jgi:amidophosphoribosyltransferase
VKALGHIRADWHESCGIFGIFAPNQDVARLTFFALFALQHRGQESSGIAAADGNNIWLYTGMGLVSHVFDEEALSRLTGTIAIGHNRYSTTGSSQLANAQPILVEGPAGKMALAHNGNIVNAEPLRQELSEQGCRFRTSTDSEVIANLIVTAPGRTWVDRIGHAMHRLQGAYSLVILTADSLIGVRDPLGVRPLCLGELNGSWALASETCALDHIGIDCLREVQPGEIVVIGSDGLMSFQGVTPERNALCVFEYIYFARPDSTIGGRLLFWAREAMGRRLAQEYPVPADLVIGVPDSATVAAVSYARESGIPFTEGLLKNRYVGRTFIEPDQRIRQLGVGLKFNPLRQILDGKRLIVVDDSIVRGTTTPHVIRLLRKAGAKEIHMRVCAPPIRFPCFFGVDMARRWELLAARKSVPQIQEFIGADSLGYLSLDGLVEAVGLPAESLCLACLTGDYPIPVQLEMDKLALETLAAERTAESQVVGSTQSPP